MRLFSLIVGLALLMQSAPLAGAQTPTPSPPTPVVPRKRLPLPSPFTTPQATLHYAPDRDYDLLHLALNLTIDYPHRAFAGVVTNRIAALHEGVKTLSFHCAHNLTIQSCTVDSTPATFRHDADMLVITAPRLLARGTIAEVGIRYKQDAHSPPVDSAIVGGLHWIEPNRFHPERVGFWTKGEPEYNHAWLPTWDYPNHLTTTETTVTVPAAWTVIGNGALRSDRLNVGGKTRTVHWQMTQPHATYLLSLAAGPFDVKTATWRGVPLMYIAPKGKGHLLESSFGNTPDMLSFFSEITGVQYAWPKYAQSAMVGFSGGMENVTATTLPAYDLTDAREGFHTMDRLNAHELSHQWFGDLVTCKDWSHVWLNESFATLFEALYLEHSRGEVAYAQEIDHDMESYFYGTRWYKRPLVTNVYERARSMFDSHTYAKGGAVLHTLRRTLGDKLFFAGLHLYLTRHQHTPVDTNDLCRAMTEATGVDLEPFFAQWIYKPGHPVLDTTWTWEETTKKVLLIVKQIQDTTDGTPIYTLRSSVGLLLHGHMTRVSVALHQAEEVFTLDAPSKPDAVLLDPDHDFLRDIPTKHWTESELPVILKNASSPADRAEAMIKMLAGTPSDNAIQTVVAAVQADTARFPVFSLTRLGELKREDLRPLFRAQLRHASFDRRVQAIRALGLLPRTPEDSATLTALVTDREPYAVVSASITTLTTWDSRGSLPLLTKAVGMSSLDEQIRNAAYSALARSPLEEGMTLLLRAADPEVDTDIRWRALTALEQVDASDVRPRGILRVALLDSDFEILDAAVNAIRARKEKALVPDLQALRARLASATTTPRWFIAGLDHLITELTKPQ